MLSGLFGMFYRYPLNKQIKHELLDAYHDLHRHETAAAFSTKMAEYHRETIVRLEKQTKQLNQE